MPVKKRYHGHPDFYRILGELGELHNSKNAQYASHDDPLGNFRRNGELISKLIKPENKELATAMIMMSKQITAVYDMVGEDKKNTVESLDDKFSDIAVYAILCKILLKESE